MINPVELYAVFWKGTDTLAHPKVYRHKQHATAIAGGDYAERGAKWRTPVGECGFTLKKRLEASRLEVRPIPFPYHVLDPLARPVPYLPTEEGSE